MCFLRLGDKINKRLGAMNKSTDVVHRGWMTKSPPEQKLQSALKIFRAKWKQRYFVLHKPSGSLPNQYELSYYNSEQCTKKKGSIDLEQCEQIIESLDSDQYPYLLAIKTVCRGKVRTYYLATNSEEDMGTWVQCLCHVCGLKQEDTPTDIPDARLSVHGLSGSAMSASPPTAGNSSVRSTVTASPTITSQPLQAPPSRTNTIASSSSSSNSQLLPSTSPQSYVFLNECTTGTPERHSDQYGRADSTDSAPEYQAPPPPPDKKGTHVHNSEHAKNSPRDSVFDVYDHPPNAGHQETYDRPQSGGQELYDRPRSGEFGGSRASLDGNDVYKVPPSARGPASMLRVTRSSVLSDNMDLNAAVPLPVPRHSPRSARSSLSDRPDSMASMGRPMTENYDVPPPRQTSTSSQYGAGGSSDAPPTPPLRPPKPHSLMPQSPYQNVPSNSKAYEGGSLSAVPAAAPKVCQVTLSYNVPRASTVVSPPRDSSGLALAPPPPRQSTHAPSGGHSYVNSVPGLSSSPAVPPLPSTYLPMKNGERGDMTDTPPGPSQCRDASYTDMSGAGGGNGGQDLYQVPPVAPRPPAYADTLPAGRLSGAATVGPVGDVEAQVIWSNMHTKSFKRKNQVNRSPLPARPPPPLEPRRPPLPVRSEFASSSEDDDDLSVDGNNTHHDLSVVRMSTVPAPPADPDPEPELKYLDLALDTPPPDPSRSQASASHGAPTEYREIDFIKTQALQDTKRARNMKK